MGPKFDINQTVKLYHQDRSRLGKVREIRLWRRDETFGYKISTAKGDYWFPEAQLSV